MEMLPEEMYYTPEESTRGNASVNCHITLMTLSCNGRVARTGTFGQVLECWDREIREVVAIKIVRSIKKKYRDAAMVEIDVLKRLGRYNRHINRCVVWTSFDKGTCEVSFPATISEGQSNS